MDAFIRGLITIGLLPVLAAYQDDDLAVLEVIQQLYQSLSSGMDWESALRAVSPALPGVLTELLILGSAQAQLDYVAQEIDQYYKKHTQETELYQALSGYLRRLETGPHPAIICQSCLVQTLEKILARATFEGTHRVILKQTGHAFFEQNYLGVKLIAVREPCHALTYRTLYKALEVASQNQALAGEGWAHDYQVSKTQADSYQIKSPHQVLECVFSTALSTLAD